MGFSGTTGQNRRCDWAAARSGARQQYRGGQQLRPHVRGSVEQNPMLAVSRDGKARLRARL